MSPEAQRRANLATLLWPNRGQRQARKALNRQLSELNNVIGAKWVLANTEIGQPIAALQQYQACQEAFEIEFGVPPSAEMTQIRSREIDNSRPGTTQTASPSLPNQPHTNLPPKPRPSADARRS